MPLPDILVSSDQRNLLKIVGLLGWLLPFLVFGQVDETKQGPWGKLQYFETILEPTIPEHVFHRSLDLRTVWEFPHREQEDVRKLLASSDISPEWIEKLCEEGTWADSLDGLTVNVPDSLVERLTPEQRTELYPKIYRKEKLSSLSFNIQRGDLDLMTEDLPPQDVERIRTFLFRRGETLSLIDVGPLLRSLSTMEDIRRVYAALVRVKAMVAEVEICEDDNLESIVNYWSARGHNPNVSELLDESVIRSSRTTFDLIHLLPRFPKRYLNTYPRLSDANSQAATDCWWTAVNFFSVEPSRRVLDPLPLDYFLERDFEPAQPPYQLGDLVLLFELDENDEGVLVHAYNHIADDIVFSKNGAGMVQPWVLIRESDVLSLYSHTETERKVYRKLAPQARILANPS